MTFSNSHRVNSNAAFFIRKPVTEQGLRLVLKSENSEDDVLLYTSPKAYFEMDKLDAKKLHVQLQLASISSGKDLAINALPTDFTGTVALNLVAPKTGVYKLSVKELSGVNITLEDRKTDTFTILNPITKLDLTLSESNKGRFSCIMVRVIHLTKPIYFL